MSGDAVVTSQGQVSELSTPEQRAVTRRRDFIAQMLKEHCTGTFDVHISNITRTSIVWLSSAKDLASVAASIGDEDHRSPFLVVVWKDSYVDFLLKVYIPRGLQLAGSTGSPGLGMFRTCSTGLRRYLLETRHRWREILKAQ